MHAQQPLSDVAPDFFIMKPSSLNPNSGVKGVPATD